MIVALAAAAFFILKSPKPVTEGPVVDNSGSVAGQASGGCFIGGCSNQICSDQEGLISTCEFKEEYACYKTATCKRQESGECGWTQTPGLQACLNLGIEGK